MKILQLLLGLLLWWSTAGHAAIDAYQFESPAQEALFRELTAELRCLVCQNQNIADSNAELAKDLRDEIHTMLRDGSDKTKVLDFMVQRYGDFVLYRPPVNRATAMLWFGPFLIGLLGLIILIRYIRTRIAAVVVDETLSDAERSRLRQLMGKGDT